MTSSISFKDNQVWGTNGTIEEILIKLIKHSPDDSRLLPWAIEQYRESFMGMRCDLTESLTDQAEFRHWQTAMGIVLDELKSSGIMTEYGISWIDEHRDDLINIIQTRQAE